MVPKQIFYQKRWIKWAQQQVKKTKPKPFNVKDEDYWTTFDDDQKDIWNKKKPKSK